LEEKAQDQTKEAELHQQVVLGLAEDLGARL